MAKAATKRVRLRDDVRDLNAFARERDFKHITWEKVSTPKAWTPAIGETLLGYYHGRSMRSGQFGAYEVVQVLVPAQGLVFVSGVSILQLVTSAQLETGTPVRIEFKGVKDLEDGHKKKLFELYVATKR